MLMKICARCGAKIPQGKNCRCRIEQEKQRQKDYNAERRDVEKNKFYHSGAWERLTVAVKARANGLDEYALSQGKIEAGNTVHHIYTLEERPDLKYCMDNLIYLTAKNHGRIHSEYNKDSATRKNLQEKLSRLVRTFEGRG